MSKTKTKTKSKAKTAPSTKRVRFSCEAPDANCVCIAGDFNEWSPDTTPLKKGKDGVWSISLTLAPGSHEFKFVIDHQWECKPGSAAGDSCPDCVPNEFGTMNHVLEVAE